MRRAPGKIAERSKIQVRETDRGFRGNPNRISVARNRWDNLRHIPGICGNARGRGINLTPRIGKPTKTRTGALLLAAITAPAEINPYLATGGKKELPTAMNRELPPNVFALTLFVHSLRLNRHVRAVPVTKFRGSSKFIVLCQYMVSLSYFTYETKICRKYIEKKDLIFANIIT